MPKSARHTEPHWIRVLPVAAIGGDLWLAVIGTVGRPADPVRRSGRRLVPDVRRLAAARLGRLRRAGPWLRVAVLPLGPGRVRSILRSGVGLTTAVAIVSYATKSEIARGFVVLAIPATVMLGLLLRYALRRDLSRHRDLGQCMRRVLVVGRNGQAATVAEHLQKEPSDGFIVVASCLPRGDRAPADQTIVDLAEADILAAVDAYGVDVVAVAADPELAGQSLRRLSWALEQRSVDLIVSPGIVEVAGPRISVRPVAGLSLLHLERPSVSGGPHLRRASSTGSRRFLILMLSPLLLTIAAAVRLTSRARRCSGRPHRARWRGVLRCSSSARCAWTPRAAGGPAVR